MENGWNLIDNSSGSRGQNGNCSNLAWNIWELGTSRFDWNSPNNPINEDPPATATIVATSSTASTTPTPTPTHPEASTVHAFMFSHQGNNLYDGAGSNYHPDPHLMCLKLGKRHYFEDATTLSDCHHVGGFSITKRGKPFDEAAGGGFAGPSTSERVTVASPATVPRCQVEGCNVALVDAKDYHRRHKVCEMHSKAEKVVVLGAEQRFCQQCSRFHAVSQFDDSKRSCRRRLAGHNERRRKSSHDSVAKNPPQGRALSLLSMKNNSGISSADLSSRCSAALSELIAENRAAILARQLIIDRDSHWRHQTMEDMNGPQTESSNSVLPPQHQMFLEPHGWERFNEAGSHVTLDLMQAPSSAFGLLSVRGKSKEDEEQCSEWWSSFGGAHAV